MKKKYKASPRVTYDIKELGATVLGFIIIYLDQLKILLSQFYRPIIQVKMSSEPHSSGCLQRTLVRLPVLIWLFWA